jgi:hypothetical protein
MPLWPNVRSMRGALLESEDERSLRLVVPTPRRSKKSRSPSSILFHFLLTSFEIRYKPIQMPSDYFDINSIMDDRRKAVEKSIRTVGAQELKDLGEKLFPNLDDSWRELYFDFIHENAGNTFHYAETQEGFHVIYCRAKEKGIWFIPGKGKGPLQARGLRIMNEVVDQI